MWHFAAWQFVAELSAISMQTHLQMPQGCFELKRLPDQKNQRLQAWDAADEYLLNYLAEEKPQADVRMVILNDSFGALALALHQYRPSLISDSFLSQQATRLNLQANHIPQDSVRLLDSMSLPDEELDYLLIKIPKTLALLEYQLHQLRPLLKPSCKIIAAGMVKALPANAWKMMERLLGPTVPALAVKKARLIFASLDQGIKLPSNPYPVRYRLENSDVMLVNHANVFSRDSLDIGTRLLLQHLPDHPEYRRIIDLGCGNGVVGLMLAKRLPQAEISFVDESFMALASAQENFQRAFAGQRQANFVAGDGLTGFQPETADCVVCNPPFHQQHTIGDHIAQQMFQQARHVLRKGGELRIIGNRHLNYQHSLKKLFGHWEPVASNAKFVIIKAFKR